MFDQAAFDIRCEWGLPGILALAPTCDVVIIVDVLSFTTSVDIATGRGALVYPHLGSDESAIALAASLDAELAYAGHSRSGYTLAPHSLLNVPSGTRLVMPSHNGSALTMQAITVQASGTATLAGCLRNSRAVAAAAQHLGRRIAVIPAGECWPGDGSLRPAFEDWVGAGAIIRHLEGRRSPEAQAAAAACNAALPTLPDLLAQCGSGQELAHRGREQDIALAAALDVSDCAPIYRDGAYVRFT